MTSVKQFKHGVQAFIKMGVCNTGYTTQEEAEKRADICVGCAHNNTDSTSKLIVFMEATTSRKTKHSENLGVCGLCGCVLNTLVHAENDLVDTTDIRKHPTYCWKHEISREKLNERSV